MISSPIYKRDSTGKLRSWAYEVDGNKYRTIAGIHRGNLVTSAWTTCRGKQGRNDHQQAQFEAAAEFTKKLDREYRRTIEELDAVPQSPMLAKSYDDLKGTLTLPVFSQPKLDGIRALITRHGAFSREYQPHLNVEHITQALAPLFTGDMRDVVFDGELYNHDFKDDFGKISSIVRKQKPTEAQRIEARAHIQFHCYDIGDARLNFATRFGLMTMIEGMCQDKQGPIRFVPTSLISNASELDRVYGEYLEQGYEGQMVRLNEPYEFDKRSKFLLKRKEFITAEFKLLRIEEGQGNWAGYAKRVVFELPDGRECGAGIRGTQSDMRRLLERNKDYLSWFETSQVTVRHFTPTPDGMPRFPVAIDFHFGGRKD